MRQVKQCSKTAPWLIGSMAVGLLLAAGCHGEVGAVSTGSGGSGGTTGADGGAPPAPCTGTSDPRLVVAGQRFLNLTHPEIVNTIQAVLGSAAATSIASDPSLALVPTASQLRFPPLSDLDESIGITSDPQSLPTIDSVAQAVASYVFTNFQTITKCPTGASATDSCATTYLLNTLAPSAYRRPLSSTEQARFTQLYNDSKSQLINGWQVTSTVEEATQNAVYGIFMSPQMLWRSEIGDATKKSTSPPGIPLTDSEIATALSFYLTDAPPDATLLTAAMSGQLAGNPSNVLAQANRILMTQASKTWLSQIMLVYYRLNLLADASPDPAKFPLLNSQPNVVSDMYSEAQQFMNYILWNDKLTGVLLSQTAFVNSTLAQYVYQIPIPSGATPTNFVQTTFPASAHRTGIITNAAYITSVAGADRESVVKRGLLTKDVLLCLKTPPPPLDTLGAAIKNAGALFDFQTEQQQVDYRKSIAVCASCHGNFDSYGLVLDGYDNLGVTRTTEPVKDMTTGVVSQVPIAYTATLPPTLGGGPVVDAVDLAQKLAASDVFTHCEMQAALQLAMGDINTAYVEMPTPPDVNPAAAGCAVLAATQSYSGASGQTFSDLLRAAVVSPTFLLRTAVQ